MSVAKPTFGRQVLVGVILLAAVAGIAGFGSLANAGNTDGWYERVNKVAWDPPNWLFGPAWSVLYLLIAVAGFLIWRAGYRGGGRQNRARRPLALYIVQLAFNAAWSPTFFAGYPLIGEAAWWIAMGIISILIALVIWLIFVTFKWSKAAAWLLGPYVTWMAFASTLNAGIIALN